MRILITGSNGTLGSDLVDLLASQYEIAGLGLSDNRHAFLQYYKADIANSSAVLKAVQSFKPAIIIHTAAYIDVDGCELNPNQAYLINTKGTQHIAEASNQTGAIIFFISSDYIFDGRKKEPYLETDSPNPMGVYGQSKLNAEEWLKTNSKSAWIIRSSWLFGKSGRNFFRLILQRMIEKKELKVVNDQLGAPTYTRDLAQGLKTLIERGKRVKGCEIFHLANSGTTTWYEAAQKLVAKTGEKIEIKPITSTELNRPARRPANSVLNMQKIETAYGIKLRNWEAAFNDFWNDVLSREWLEAKNALQKQN